MKQVYLIRHGQSEHNADRNRLSGITDVPLTEEGKQQCSSLADVMEPLAIEEIIATPLQRSIQSAKLIFPNRASDIVVCPVLTEFNYGDYEAADPSSLPSDDPIIQAWNTDPSHLTFPNGSNISDHAEQAYNGLVGHLNKSNSDSFAFISHRTTIRLLVAKILRIPLQFFRSIPCDNCAITKLEFGSDKLSLTMLNTQLTYLEE